MATRSNDGKQNIEDEQLDTLESLMIGLKGI
jgi:hypothetical protein